MNKAVLIFLLAMLSVIRVCAQCTTLGQNPSTAFPVCGTTVFNQTTVPICGSTDLTVPGCSGRAGAADYQNKNPFWYKFTCFQSGTLNFQITPLDLNDDYDWQLYDITGHNPNDVFTTPSLVVTGNWAGTYGVTGASSTGLNRIQCASDPASNENSFALSPKLIAGHDYLLLVSHFTASQSGYGLQFSGGTAVITDPKLPALLSGEAACDSRHITIRLNKKMKCKSLAADGSDFSINTPLSSIISASSIQCATGFDMDSVILTLNNPRPPGTFKVSVKTSATDGNTLLDNCDRGITPGDNISFIVYPLAPTPMDSIAKVKCAPTSLELVFKKNILCSSVAANGSDFVVTGPSGVTVISASGGACGNGLSKKITVSLSSPIQLGGLYTISLQRGTDGNTLLDECSQETPAGSRLSVNVADTVNADFNFSINYGCSQNSVNYTYPSANGVNKWTWSFDKTATSSQQNPVITYTNFRPTTTILVVSNGVCSDTSSQNIVFDNLLEANFSVSSAVCPDEPAVIVNQSAGRIVEWNWKFGNGVTSTIQNPPPQNYVPRASSNYLAVVELIVKNDYGCYDTITKGVQVVFSCFITVPTAFTPNGDGLNDYLYPLSAYKSADMSFSVYNRFGQRVFFSTNWTNKWDGKYKGQGADPGTYVWVLSYLNTDTNRRVEQKGTTILIR
jgi:gliding motility-associated-like protein